MLAQTKPVCHQLTLSVTARTKPLCHRTDYISYALALTKPRVCVVCVRVCVCVCIGVWGLLDENAPESGVKLTYSAGTQCDGRTGRCTTKLTLSVVKLTKPLRA